MKTPYKYQSCIREKDTVTASLTVEAALVTPIFLYFMLVFLYFIQFFILQEQIQSAITRMGMDISRLSYIINDFTDLAQTEQFDDSMLQTEMALDVKDIAKAAVNGGMLKLYAKGYLDFSHRNLSCIKDGYDGISFHSSKVMDQDDCIDIIVRYEMRMPIRLFGLDDKPVIQRVRLRSWTGRQVPAAYSQEAENLGEDPIVYITTSGSVYHLKRECSHIKLSITSVVGIPSELRNDNGAKYYSCEACITGTEEPFATYYITSDGTRYHSRKDCSKLKRTVKEIKLSQVANRTKCKRCGD